jgi:hypothetical protein
MHSNRTGTSANGSDGNVNKQAKEQFQKMGMSNYFVDSNGDQLKFSLNMADDGNGNVSTYISRSINNISWKVSKQRDAQGLICKEKLTNMDESKSRIRFESKCT